jgi:hypothetical protein
MYGLKAAPFKKGSSHTRSKALISSVFYGTAEPVPFVEGIFLSLKAVLFE